MYLLRYTDKIRVLRAAAKKLKGNIFKDSNIYLRRREQEVRSRRAQLRRDHLPHYKEKENVEFAFILWSVPAQILYTVSGEAKLKSFQLTPGEYDE